MSQIKYHKMNSVSRTALLCVFLGCILLALLAWPAKAATVASGTCGDNLTWSLDDAGTLTISGTGEMNNYSSGSAPWFSQRSSVSNVLISEGVTSIGDNAFSLCSSLANVSISDNVVRIGDSAFSGCSTLTSIVLPNSVTTIGSNAFYSCTNLTGITISNHAANIGSNAFYSCKKLTEVTIPDSVTDIGPYAFYSCSSLTSIVLPNTLTTINEGVFYSCQNLVTVSIPNSVTTIDEYAFYNCNKISEVFYSSNYWDWSAITIGNYNDPIIEAYKRLDPPSGNCGDNLTWTLDDNGLLIINGTGPMYDYSEVSPFIKESVKQVIISNGVTSVGNYAFYQSSELQSITFPVTLTHIGSHAFEECNRIVQIDLPINLQTMGDSTFRKCTSLKSVSINNKLTSIPDYAFQADSVLENIVIPSNISTVGDRAFATCTGLKNIVFKDGILKINNRAFADCDALTSIEIPGSVTEIGEGAFVSCNSLNTVIMHPGLIIIGDSAFANNKNVKTWNIPNTVTRIGTNAFFAYSDTVTLIIPDSVSYFGYTFLGNNENDNRSAWTIKANCGSYASQINFTYGKKNHRLNSVGQDYYWYTTENVNFVSTGHISEYTVIKEPTCSEVGLAYTKCASCGQKLSENEEIPIVDHQAVSDQNGIAPTCTESGLTDSMSCKYCKMAMSPQEVIPALGHAWNEPTYIWAEDNTSVTASRVCSHDDTHIETETVSVTAEENIAPTCTEMGKTTYTSGVFVNDAFAVQTKTLTDINALGHEWSEPEYTWSDDNTFVTAVRICTHDETHIETETAAVTSEITFPASCTEMGRTTYTAVFENEVFETQTKTLTDIDATDHQWNDPVYTWSSDNSKLTAKRVCAHDVSHTETETVPVTEEVTKNATCMEMGQTTYTSAAFKNTAFSVQTKTLTNIDALGHEWGEPEYTWSEDNKSVTAVRVCAHDETHIETETVSVTAEVTKAATCEEMGQTTYTAVFENEAFETQTRTLTDVEALGHEWGEPEYTWADDNTSVTATRVCAHDEAHVETETVPVMAEVTKAATCEEMGQTTYTSAAFKNTAFSVQTKTLTDIDALGHEWGEPEYAWTEDNTSVTAVRVCAHDETHIETETVSVTAEVTKAATCEEMGQTTYTAVFENEAFETQTRILTDVDALGHEWGAPAYTWSADNSKVTATRICAHDASHTETETVSVTAAISRPATCTVKGQTTYTSAAFKNAAFSVQTKTLTNIDALGHEWGEPEYTWSEDNKSVTATRVCAHDETHIETETVSVTAEVTKAATCEEMGQTTYTAVFENEAFETQTRTLTDVEALGHEWGEPEYTWADDNTSVTATRVCTHDASHTETETVSVTAAISRPATCEEMGQTTYTSAAFKNAAFSMQTKTLTDIEALGHEWGEPEYTWSEDNKSVTAVRVCAHDKTHIETETGSVTAEVTKAATCEEMGQTTYTAVFENEAFETQTRTLTDVKALGHEWGEPEYTWADDNTSVTATRVCAHDEAHVETETVSVTAEVTKTANCEEMGQTTYTSAAFKNTAFSVQTKTLTDVEAIGHDWSTPIYTWSADNSKVTAKRVCAHDASHTETETVSTTAAISRPATCTAKGQTTYTSAAFKNAAFSVQTKALTDVEAIGHQWGTPIYTWSADNSKVTAKRVCAHDASHTETETVSVSAAISRPATCEEKGQTTYTSAAFKNAAFSVQIKTLTDIDAIGHQWGMPIYTWSADSSKVTAKRVCAHDASHTETETVSVTAAISRPATCEEKGQTTYTSAAFKNAAFSVQTKTLTDVEAIGHDWSTPIYTWSADNSKVTARRVCGNDSSHIETETVSVTAEIIKPATCAEKGQTKYTSSAFRNQAFTVRTKTVVTDFLGHTVVADPAIPPTCTEPGYTEGSHCSVCGEVFVTPEPVAPLGHDDQVVLEIPAGIGREGVRHFECVRCGEKHSEIIEALPELFQLTGRTWTLSGLAKNGTAIAQGRWGNYGNMQLSFAEDGTCSFKVVNTSGSLVSGTSEWTLTDQQVFAPGINKKIGLGSSIATLDVQEDGTLLMTIRGVPTAECTFSAEGGQQTVEPDPAAFGLWQAAQVYRANTGTTVPARYLPGLSPAAVELKADQTVRIDGVSGTWTFENYLYTVNGTGLSFQLNGEGQLVCGLEDGDFLILARNVPDVTTFKLPGRLTGIEEEAFAGVPAQEVILPAGCARIGSRAFADCANLEAAVIPASVRSIADDAFGGRRVLIIAPAGSYAIVWAQNNGLDYLAQ